MPVQTKGKLKLYALTSMQTKNQNVKNKTILPSCLDKALFKGKKVGKGRRRQKRKISLG